MSKCWQQRGAVVRGGIAVLFSSRNEQRQAAFRPRNCREEGL